MWPIQQHQVHLTFKLVYRQDVLGFTLYKGHVFSSKIALFTQFGDGPVLTFDRKSDVVIACMR